MFAQAGVILVNMSTTIGQQLRQRREVRTLTIDQAASATRIRAHYLLAIESGEFASLPSPVHAKGFLRAYAEFLGLDAEPLLSELDGNAAEEAEATPPKAPPEASPSPAPALKIQEEAGSIFQGIGEQLTRQRELLGLSLDDVERHTHLRQHYLRALEAGDLDSLPSPVQGRGMLNNYAGFLGLNPEPLMLRFADGLQAQLEARRAAQPESKPIPIRENLRPPSLLRRLLSADILIGGSIAVFLVIFVIWGSIRIFSMTSVQEISPTAPSIAEVLLATATPSETPTPLPVTATRPSPAQLFPTLPVATGTVVAGAPPGGGAAVQVYLTINQRAWMRVTVDGKVQFDGRVLAGSAYPFIGDNQVEVLTGNGAALQVFYNGADQGVLGELGEVVDLIYTPQGILEPTATLTPTPSATFTPGAKTPTLTATTVAP
jgi:cytoskeleton protein RodZ